MYTLSPSTMRRLFFSHFVRGAAAVLAERESTHGGGRGRNAKRHASSVGEDSQAALDVKLAEEQINEARSLMKHDENKRADEVLQRADNETRRAAPTTVASRSSSSRRTNSGLLRDVERVTHALRRA
jgi:hypothetical protein